MTMLPPVPSPTPATVPDASADGPCRFCGFRAEGWMRTTVHAGQPAPVCLLCFLYHDLDRPRINEEAILVWLPEMTQRALVAVVRRLHLICAEHDEPPTMDGIPKANPLDPLLYQARGVYLALLRRSATAATRLGSLRPSDLAAVLAELADGSRASAPCLGGLRLLPLGRFFGEDGADLYPQALSDLLKKTGASA